MSRLLTIQPFVIAVSAFVNRRKHKIPSRKGFFMEKKLRTLLFQEKSAIFWFYSYASIAICRSSRSLI